MTKRLHKNALWSGAIATALWGCLVASPAEAGGVAGDLLPAMRQGQGKFEWVQVVVQFKGEGVDSARLAQTFGGRRVARHRLVDAATIRVPRHLLAALSRDPQVKWISPDRELTVEWDEDTAALGADQVWNGTSSTRGSGIRVAVLDTGVAVARDFNRTGSTASRLVAWKDCVNGRLEPYDDNGHGTHVAGIAVGNGAGSDGTVKGVAPEADLVAVKVLSGNGGGSVSTVIAGLDWVGDNAQALNIRVVNLSLGAAPQESSNTDPLCAAVRRLVRRGVVVVVSAGNKGKDPSGVLRYGGISSPGNEASAITVGALNTWTTANRSDDTVCGFSSRGPTYIDNRRKPDLVAPGNRIVSVRSPGSYLDLNYPLNQVDHTTLDLQPAEYYHLSGTSMAAPQVTGTVALMFAVKPGLKPNSVKGALMFSAQRLALKDAAGAALTPGLSLLTQGAGSLNTAGAVAVVRSIDTNKLKGERWLTGILEKQSTIAGFNFPWAQELLHGNQVLWGEELLAVNQVLWGEDPVWGDPVAWTQQILWGEDPVDGEQVLWSQHLLWLDQILWGENSLWSESAKDVGLSGE